MSDRETNQDLFYAIVEASPNAILMVDSVGTITLANHRAEQLFHYKRAELLGQNVERLLPERYRRSHKELRHEFMRNAVTRPMGAGRDLYCRRKDGSEVPVEIGLSPLSTSKGVYVLASIIDITERKKSEEEALLQTRALECAANGIVITNVNGKVVWVNRAFSDSTGYEASEVLGRNPRFLKSGKHDRAFYQRMWQTILECKVWRDTIVNRRKDGTLINEDLTITPIQNAAGNITHFIAIKQDITERLREQEQYRVLFQHNPAPMWVFDRQNLRFLAVNDAAIEHYGFSREEFLSMTVRDIRPPQEVPRFEQSLMRIAGGLNRSGVWKHWKKDGTLIDVEINSSAMDFNGQVAELVLVNDITERLRAQEALRLKTEELAAMTTQLWQASKLATMGELAASVAHELNNPLATVGLRAEALLSEISADDPKRRSLQVISQEVDRMAGLVDNLLQFSRRSHRQVSTVDVREEIGNSVDFIDYHLRSHKIAVEREFADPLPPIHADRQQLRQLFLNLLTNASDAMPQGGTLTIRAAAASLNGSSAVAVDFADTGEGIAPENLEKVWEPFFTTKPEGKGTGLGLAICRRIVEEHDGGIQIKSEPGEGTSIHLLFPATAASQDQI